MVLSEFLSDTRRRWTKALKLLKRSSKRRKSEEVSESPRRNRVTPTRECPRPPYSGTVDASADIAVERFCRCPATPTPTPPFPADADTPDSTYENLSYCSDSAYDTDRSRSSPSWSRDRDIQKPVYEVSFYPKVSSRESDTCSVTTVLTWLELELELQEADEQCESRQNALNERLELMTTL